MRHTDAERPGNALVGGAVVSRPGVGDGGVPVPWAVVDVGDVEVVDAEPGQAFLEGAQDAVAGVVIDPVVAGACAVGVAGPDCPGQADRGSVGPPGAGPLGGRE